MTTKTVHTFDDSGLTTGPLELDASYLVPFTTNLWSLPRNCVEFAPPPTGAREIARINAARTAWTVIPYWVGHVYWLADRTRHEIHDAGVEPPPDALAADPGPSLDQAKAAKLNLIALACEAAIVAGFESSALGQPCTYPCKLTDQTNLMASVSASREAETDAMRLVWS
ncbi:MAG: hypothetical protein EOP40_15000, partial [Rubrivivax sp.]